MTLTDRIAAWLTTDDDYNTGLSLLEESGYSGFTLGLLRRGENVYNRAKLVELLGKQQPAEQSSAVQLGPGHASPGRASPGPTAVVETNDSSAIVPVPKPIDDSLSTGIKALEQQRSQLFDERGELKAFIRATLDDDSDEAVERRRPWSLRIKAIGRAISEIYSRLHFAEQNGYLPLQTDPSVEIDDRAALLNARSYVSRYKRKTQDTSLTLEQRRNAQRLLDQYTLEKDRLEQKLKQANDSHTSRQQAPDCPNNSPVLPGT